MDSHALPNCRPLVGPGNTNHALDGPRRRPCFRQCFIIDMERHLDTNRPLALHRPPYKSTLDATKNPKAGIGLGVRFLLHFDAMCEPYGRRFKAPVITTRPVGFAVTSYCYSTWRQRRGQARSLANGGKKHQERRGKQAIRQRGVGGVMA